MIWITVLAIIACLVCIFVNVYVIQNAYTPGLARLAFGALLICFLGFVLNVIALVVNLTGPTRGVYS